MASLQASAGQVDLEPPVGGWMTGFAARILPTTGAHDAIQARALWLEEGSTALLIVSCDLIGFTAQAVAGLRARIAARAAIPAANILISCTHTHSGPASMPFRGVMGHVDQAWLDQAQDRIVDLAAGLPGRLEPARVASVAAPAAGLGYNRQDPSRPIDSQLGVLAVDGLDGRAIATLLNYAMHAVVLGPRNLEYSGDYPGQAARQIAERRGGVGLFLLGACGDVDPVVYRDRGWGSGTFEDTRAIGRVLAGTALEALAGAVWSSEARLRVASRSVDLPLDPPPDPAQLAALVGGFQADRAAAQAAGNRMNEWIALAMLDWAREMEGALGAGAVPRALPIELFAAAVGDARIVAVPLEPYSDISLGLKQRLQAPTVLFAGYSNGLFGYCAAAWAKAQGGYGPDSSVRWFPGMLTAIGYGAAERVVEEGASLAEAMMSSALTSAFTSTSTSTST